MYRASARDFYGMNNPLVAVSNLTKHFQIGRNQVVHAVDSVSLDINEREIVGLVGESGSGKSTLGKTMIGLHDKTDGRVVFDGEQLPQMYSSSDFQKVCSSYANDLSGSLFVA